jgi:diguanylate cyclase (GGDEF)-like protein
MIVANKNSKNRISDVDTQDSKRSSSVGKTALYLTAGAIGVTLVFSYLKLYDEASLFILFSFCFIFVKSLFARFNVEIFKKSDFSSEEIRVLKSQEEKLAKRVFIDQVTGLPNVFGLEKQFHHELIGGSNNKNQIALMRVNIDSVNKSIYLQNLAIKDLLMVEVAKVLKNIVRSSDLISRIGYNDFIIVLTGLSVDDDDEIVPGIAKKIINKIKASIEVNGFKLLIDCNIGAAIVVDTEESFDDVLRRAETALANAKKRGLNVSAIHTTAMDVEMRTEISAIERIRDGINNNEFLVNYQPRIDLKTGEVVGCEALVRWDLVSDEDVLPENFIHMAEASGLVGQIDKMVVEAACKQVSEWKHISGLENIRIAVNLSHVDFRSEDFEAAMIEVMEKYHVSPKQIELDISAYSLNKDFAQIHGALARMSAIGHKIYLDDTGSSYTSISQIASLKLNCLNISKNFVADICKNAHSEEIIRSLIQLAKLRNIKVLAKGIENKETLDKLCSMGCDYGQGWYWSRALPAKDYVEFINTKEASQ